MPSTYANDIQKKNDKTKRKQQNYTIAIWEYCIESLIVYSNAQDNTHIYFNTACIATTTK